MFFFKLSWGVPRTRCSMPRNQRQSGWLLRWIAVWKERSIIARRTLSKIVETKLSSIVWFIHMNQNAAPDFPSKIQTWKMFEYWIKHFESDLITVFFVCIRKCFISNFCETYIITNSLNAKCTTCIESRMQVLLARLWYVFYSLNKGTTAKCKYFTSFLLACDKLFGIVSIHATNMIDEIYLD